jgi:hypothetical protein
VYKQRSINTLRKSSRGGRGIGWKRSDCWQRGFSKSSRGTNGTIVGEKSVNVSKGISLISEAANKGAKLIVLPELCNSGYVFNSREEAFSLAEPIPDGETTQTWIEVAKKHQVYITAGIAERCGN